MNIPSQPKNPIERVFEWLLWKSRLVVLFAVIFGVLGALGLFLLGSYEIYHTIIGLFPLKNQLGNYSQILIGIIGAIDLYLIGIVLLLFSFGIYELFVSEIDIARMDDKLNILDIKSLDDLKNRVLKVVVVVLIISFFKSILTLEFTTPLEMVCFAASIVAVAGSVYLIRKREGEN